jgi:hypothetical protein
VNEQTTADRGQMTGAKAAAVVVWFFAVAIIALPLVAHGCHAEDLDTEPGAMLGPPDRAEPLQ